jgi:hypothetical protein
MNNIIAPAPEDISGGGEVPKGYLHRKDVSIAGFPLTIVSNDAVLWIPTTFLKDEGIEQALVTAEAFISSLPDEALDTPWIVGSYLRALDGSDRVAESHASGNAIDLTPWYDAENVIAPNGAITGLAWNILSLATLAQSTYNDTLWVVEGDHIHLELEKGREMKALGIVYSVPTISPWYALSRRVSPDTIMGRLFLGKTFEFQLKTMSVRGPSDEVTRAMLSKSMMASRVLGNGSSQDGGKSKDPTTLKTKQ